MEIKKAWGSHLPVLMKVISLTEGDVLELGMGLYSTPYLHWACLNKRKLVSYDNDSEIFPSLKKEYGEGLHEVNFVDDWSKIDIEKPWDVVLVDHAPVARRSEEIKRLANFAKFIVIHDSQERDDKTYHYSTIYPLFKYKLVFDKAKPPTTLLSNFVDINNLII
jgi:hypothetical protein